MHTIYIYIYLYIPHLLYPFLYRLCFHVLTVVSSAAVNIEVDVYFQIMVWDYWITQ